MEKTILDKRAAITLMIAILADLPYRDKEKLVGFLNRTDDTIKNVFGESSGYRTELKTIRFAPLSFYSTPHDYQEAWDFGKTLAMTLLTRMLNDPEVRGEEDPAAVGHEAEELQMSSESREDQTLAIAAQTDEETAVSKPGIESREPSADISPQENSVEGTEEQLEELASFLVPEEPALSSPDSAAPETAEQLPVEVPAEPVANEPQPQEITDHEAAINPSEDETEIILPEEPEHRAKPIPPAAPNRLRGKEEEKTPAQLISEKIDQFQQSLTTISQFSANMEKLDQEKKPAVRRPYQVFIVNGNDTLMLDAVVFAFQKLRFEPIMSNAPGNAGKPLTQKLNDYPDLNFAVILLSADDIAYHKEQPADMAKFRARQNIVFELGFLIGKLGRNRVFVLYQEDKGFEIPTNYFDVFYTPYDKAGRWQFDLLKKLKSLDYSVDANQLI